jgi:NAD+-dependent protein deacetylase SIR2
MKEHVFQGEVPRCVDEKCGGLVKPDIVFFGEQLPEQFHNNRHVPSYGDLALIMGTSLTVQPFASLPEMVRDETPRILFNLERVGSLGSRPDDVLVLGDCDSGVRKLADELGWGGELDTMWREVVGDKEAERQLRTAAEREAAMQAEVDDLADKVGEGLNFDSPDGHSPSDEQKTSHESDGLSAIDSGLEAKSTSPEAEETSFRTPEPKDTSPKDGVTSENPSIETKDDIPTSSPDTTEKPVGSAQASEGTPQKDDGEKHIQPATDQGTPAKPAL